MCSARRRRALNGHRYLLTLFDGEWFKRLQHAAGYRALTVLIMVALS